MFKIFNGRVIQLFLILIIFLLALEVRLWLVPHLGYSPDINFWQAWSKSITKFGIINAYEMRTDNQVMLPNYLPPYLYVLGIIGSIYQNFISPNFELFTRNLIFLLKLPAIIFDLLTGILIFLILRKQFNLKYYWSILILILYLFNPALIYNSSYWGQVDSLHTFFILLGLFFTTKNKFSWAWVLLTIALFIKLQSIIFFPLILFLNLQKRGAKNVFKNILLAVTITIVICFPFILAGKILLIIKIPFILAGGYPYISLNAFNVWWLYYPAIIFDTSKFLGLVPYFLIGLAIFFLSYFLAIKKSLKESSTPRVYLIGAFLVLVFFMFLTRVHERYLYPLFPLLALAMGKEKKILFIYLLLSFSHFANLVAVAPLFNFHYFSNFLMSWSPLFAVLNIICFFYFIYYLFVKINSYEKNSHCPANL